MLNIISPHIDDAVLSIWGIINDYTSKQRRVTVYNIFSISNWTNERVLKAFPNDSESVTLIRKKEELIVGKELKFSTVFLDFPDYPLRFNGINSQLPMKKDIKNKLEKYINKLEPIFFPLGVQHIDHKLIREIGLDLVNDGYNIMFYEDLPYCAAAEFDYQKFFNTLVTSGLSPRLCEIDIEKKLSQLTVYESQICSSWLRDIKNYSYSTLDNKFYERYWVIESVAKLRLFKENSDL